MSYRQFFKRPINAILAPLGLEMRRRVPDDPPSRGTMEGALQRLILHGVCVSTVIDVGASSGSWSDHARQAFPTANILAFEPLEEHSQVLSDRARADAKFHYVPAAAGQAQGSATLNVSDALDG